MEKKIYTKRRDKVFDFLIGFLLIPIVILMFGGSIGLLVLNWVKVDRYNYSPLTSLIIWLGGIGFAIYLGIKRKYIGIGLAIFAVVLLLLAGTCMLLLYNYGQ